MKKQGTKDRRKKLSSSQLDFGVLEPRRLLAVGVGGNDCPPDLDTSQVPALTTTVGQPLAFNIFTAGATVTDVDASGNTTGDAIRLVLDPDVGTDTPVGATITTDGDFAWTPTADQVGTFEIVVIAVDGQSPALADAETFEITVQPEVPNEAPDLLPIEDQIVTVGEELQVSVVATDPNDGQNLTFILDPENAPLGASIEQTSDTTAVISFTPTEADAETQVLFGVLVIDDGTPALVDSETFEVTVEAEPDAEPTAVALASISPTDGESLVGIERETIIRFDGEIDPATITEESFFLVANSERVPGRIEVSSTNQFATFFYDENLPAAAEVRVFVDGDAITDLDGVSIDADGDSVAGGLATFEFRTLPLTRNPGTNVFGFVRDSASGEPLVGVTIRVDGIPGLEAVTTADDPTTPDIDEAGRFELVDVPAPEFFVTIDGSTVTGLEDGLTYPTLGKSFSSTPGLTTQLTSDGVVHDIFLPLFPLEDVQALSTDIATEVGFGEAGLAELQELFPDIEPEIFEEFRVTFEPGSARDDDGNLATEAVVIPVSPDRLPAPLPVGINPPLIVSVQAGIGGNFNDAGGATNFDVPAQIVFPNIDGLAPGLQTLLFSFDHDAGEWIVSGTATVSEDGLSIISDPGAGVLAPGWHGVNPGTMLDDDGTSHDPPELADLADPLINAGATLLNGSALVVGVADVLSDLVIQSIPGAGPVVNLPLDLALSTISSGLSAAADIITEGEIGIPTQAGFLAAIAGDLAGFYQGFIPVAGPAVSSFSDGLGIGLSVGSTLDSLLDTIVSSAELGSDVVDWAIQNGIDLADQVAETASEIQREIEEAIDAAARAADLVRQAAEAAQNIGEYIQDTFDFIEDFLDPTPIPELLSIAEAAEPVLLDTGLTVEEAFEQLTSSGERALASISVLSEAGFTSIASAARNAANSVEQAVDSFSETVEIGTTTTTTGFFAVDLGDGQTLRGEIGDDGSISGVLPANGLFPITLFDFDTGFVSEMFVRTGASGSTIDSVRLILETDTIDTDGDSIPDIGERAIGTNPENADTDGDGISDFAELEQGLNPLDGVAATTGIQASLELLGTVQGITTSENLVFAATGSHGLAIVDATEFDLPISLGQIDLPGNATDVGVDSSLGVAAVATGAGLQLVDISDTLTPTLIDTVGIGASQVEVFGGFAFATSGNGLNVVDLLTGDIISSFALPGAGNVTDLAREGSELFLYISGSDTLAILDISEPENPNLLGQTNVGIASTDVGIAVGNGLVWLAGSGLRTVDVSDPTNPFIQSDADNFFTASRVALNGSGLGLLLPDGGSFAQLYDTSDPNDTNNFLTQFTLNGDANAVAISRGIGFIGAGNNLEIVNYRPFDADGIAPTVSVTIDAEDADLLTPGIQALEGGLVTVTPVVTDDVQVRDVELLVNGDVVATDVSFPFDFVLPVPAAATGENFTIEVRATDTGGNQALSDLTTFAIVPDTFAPTIETVTPSDGSSQFFGTRATRVRFNEAVSVESLDEAAFRIVSPGGNGLFGDADDVVIAAEVTSRDNDELVQITALENLPIGDFRLEIDEALVRDLAGNVLGDGVFTSEFAVIERPSVDELFDLVGEPQAGAFVLDGDEIRLGINADGSFIGADVGLEFAGTDFLEPGTPLAGFTVSFDGQNFTNSSPSNGTDFAVSLQDISVGDFNGVRADGVINGQLQVERVAVFNEGEQFITIAIRLTNVGDETLSNVAFLENHDPDQGTPIGVGADTTNDVILGGELGLASVVNADFPAGLTFGFGSGDPRATISIEQFFVGNPFEVIDSPVDPDGGIADEGLNIAFDIGDLAPGESTSVAFPLILARSTDEAVAIYQSTPFATTDGEVLAEIDEVFADI